MFTESIFVARRKSSPGYWPNQLGAVLALAALSFTFNVNAQVGIGTLNPQSKLHVHGGSVLGTSIQLDPTLNPFYDPDLPDPVVNEVRWWHDRGSFRSLGLRTTVQDQDNESIGMFSFASGFESTANGDGSSAFGYRSNASGTASFASGKEVSATGDYSFAQGRYVTASGTGTVAFGNFVSTNGKPGSFIFGDASSNSILNNDANNQIKMRFAGGFRFYSNIQATVGVALNSGGNAWSVISDSTKKENLSAVDGESFLKKISQLKLTSWNYKGQDPRIFRHYGPMAQDFYHAFGKDQYGTIGNDSTINQADFDGVNLIAIQALVKRTDELREMNEQLSFEVANLKKQIARRSPKRKPQYLAGKNSRSFKSIR